MNTTTRFCPTEIRSQARLSERGYPVAISESHEQAVVSTGDRRVFRRMLTDSLERQGLSAATSQKDRSKRSPWV